MNALSSYIDTFAGYGSAKAPIWFLGMEEGGGQSVEELELRIATWDARGRAPFEDLASYHRAIGVTRFFDGARPKLQPTWCALIKCLQAWRGAPADNEAIRRVQATELGAHDGPAALLELLPLPSPGMNVWTYGSLASSIPMLESRASYTKALMPKRVSMLQATRRQHKPRAVVCYGLGYREHWAAVAGTTLTSVSIGTARVLEGSSDGTYFVVAPHPARANATAFWTALGVHIRTHIQ